MAMECCKWRTNVDWRIGLDSELDNKHHDDERHNKHDNERINHDCWDYNCD